MPAASRLGISSRLPDECPSCHRITAPYKVNVRTGVATYLCRDDLERWTCWWNLPANVGRTAWRKLLRDARSGGPERPLKGGWIATLAEQREFLRYQAELAAIGGAT